MPTLLLIRILKVFTHQHVDYCHPRISGAPGRLHQLLLHLCDSCCTGCLKDICISFGRLIWQWSQGLCEGVTYPSLNPHISRWVPSSERSRFDSTCYQTKATLFLWYFRFTSFVFLGGTAGTVLTLPVSGILLNNYPWEVSPITFIIILVLMVEITSQFVFCQHDLLGPTGLLINHIICLGRLLCNFFGLPRVVKWF